MARRARSAAPPQPKYSALTREQYLVEALVQLERMAENAEQAESYVAAVNAKHRAILVRAELDQLRETERKQTPPATAEQHKAEILHEVRRLRTGATEAGSYVAASQLLRLERDLLAADEQERRQAEADRLASIPVEDLEAEARALLGAAGDA